MKKITSNQIRNMWINFFLQKGHHKENSFSLIPQHDPTLLWINAGVTPLKRYFNGAEKTPFKRIVNVQKCLRTNDIEEVGKTSLHHTFFEMLGNFSIGDYFKKEAINFAYEFLISEKWFFLPKKKLYITYFEEDRETYSLWLKKGISESNLIPLKTNFWNIGEGPCGPCTEIFFDRGFEYDSRGIELIYKDIKNNRFVEIWNIVFSQYNCQNNLNKNEYKPLPNKNIDTGAGLERLACILQNTETNFETDLFLPIINNISYLSNVKYEGQQAFKIIADHIKALVFCISDGAIFSNLGRGYVLKRILRRAFQNGKKIGFVEPFLFKLVPSVINIMKVFYPILEEKEFLISEMIKEEENKFLFHLKNGENIFSKLIKNNQLSGENFFKLYDTFGIPKEDILEYARNRQIKVDLSKFDFLLQKQKNMSRNFIKNNCNTNLENKIFLFSDFKEKSEFIGYQKYYIKTKVIKIFDKGIVLKKTPFYAISGGQMSDEGFIDNILIKKVTKLPNGQFLHEIQQKGIFYEGQEILAKIDIDKRFNSSCNHTATHLLLEALKKILGKHVQQQGSFLDSQILRFDFNHYANLSFEKLIQIEDQINDWINNEYFIQTKTKSLDYLDNNSNYLDNENFFKNKEFFSKDLVRIVKINNISSQLCCGTHVQNTKELKRFSIVSYEIIGSGMHRIEATTGKNISNILSQKTNPFFIEEQQILKKIQKMKDFFVSEKNNKFLDKMINFNNNLKLSVITKNDSYRYIQNCKDYLTLLRKKLLEYQKEFLKLKTKITLKQADKLIPNKIEKEILILIKKEIENIDDYMSKLILEYLFDKLNIDFLCLCRFKEKKLFFVCKSKIFNINIFITKIKKKIKVKGGGNNNFGQGIIEDIVSIEEFLSNWRSFL